MNLETTVRLAAKERRERIEEGGEFSHLCAPCVLLRLNRTPEFRANGVRGLGSTNAAELRRRIRPRVPLRRGAENAIEQDIESGICRDTDIAMSVGRHRRAMAPASDYYPSQETSRQANTKDHYRLNSSTAIAHLSLTWNVNYDERAAVSK